MTLTLSPDQEKAVHLLLTAKIGIITGPPGSGKTSALKTAIEQLPPGKRVLLMAPTGRAAKRMREVTSMPASTVHLALHAQGAEEGWRWEFNNLNPLPFDVVIVDEASMLDTELAAAVFGAVDVETTRLIFIGDADQLPSVGPGRVFADLITSSWVPVVRLTTIHRAAARTWVYRVAPKILRGQWEDATDDPTYKFAFFNDAEAARKSLIDIVSTRLPAKGIKDYQVMSPRYSGVLGVLALNNALQQHLNPREYVRGEPEEELELKVKGVDTVIRARDLVIQQVNDYDRAVFNGETGRVVTVGEDEISVEFDQRLVRYTRADARTNLRLAYCITIHKMQGSECEWAVVVCHSSHGPMWNRQLLYTAVTRAREGVVVVGDRAGIRLALGRDEPSNRLCALLPRFDELRESLEDPPSDQL